jgi:hypothetical protein
MDINASGDMNVAFRSYKHLESEVPGMSPKGKKVIQVFPALLTIHRHHCRETTPNVRSRPLVANNNLPAHRLADGVHSME